MCGIVGFIDTRRRFAPTQMREIVDAMRDRLAHRGPDDAGTWVSPDGLCALGHRRLSILDLSAAGHQPMLGQSKSSDPGEAPVIVFNGEIYNFVELRDELSKDGARFHTRTDTEVILELMQPFEPEALARLEGMYAFAIWDPRTRSLALARDRFGKKPLYIARGEGWLAFASELHALRAVPCFEPRIDRNALAHYLTLQYVPAPLSIFEGCRKLEPGSWLSVECEGIGLDGSGEGKLRERGGRHFRFQITEPAERHVLAADAGGPASPYDALAEELQPILRDAIARRLRSDVPLGAFLSGGIDSGLVVSMMTRDLGVPVDSFSIGFEGSHESEHEAAREVARILGVRHRDELLRADVMALLPEIASNLDEPLGDPSCLPTYLLSRFTRQHVTVALSGDGGDELFGGYRRYASTLEEAESFRKRLAYLVSRRRLWSAGGAYCNAPRFFMHTLAELDDLMGEEATRGVHGRVAEWRRGIEDPRLPLIDRMREFDAAEYMPGAVLAKVDRMSMAHSLEVRCPLLDANVARFASRLSGVGCHDGPVLKPVLRALASRYMPAHHVARRKMGFGLPAGAWAHRELVEQCQSALLGSAGRLRCLLDEAGLARWVERAQTPRGFRLESVWTLLIAEHWLRAQGM